MAVATLNTLRSALADTINRDDLLATVTAFSSGSVDGAIDRAIAFATKAIERDLVSRGGYKDMETLTTSLVTVGSQEYVNLPSDFAGARTLSFSSGGNDTVLEFLDPTSLLTQYPSQTSGLPEKYTIIWGSTPRIYFRPIPDGAYTLRLIYLQTLTVLTTSAVNWVLEDNPDIYIARAMQHLCEVVQEDERVQYWKGQYDQDINDLMGDDRNVRWAAVPQMPSLNVAIA